MQNVKFKRRYNKKTKRSGRYGRMGPSPIAVNFQGALTDYEVARCDFCLLDSSSNKNGQFEELLACTDCGAKAHPTCMDYGPELATRSRLAPWQCISCKTCTVCGDPGNADAMLFCDFCDKGYHMNCHLPVVNEKPTGKWACGLCLDELSYPDSDESMSPSKDKNYLENNPESNICQINTEVSVNGEKSPFMHDYPNVIPDASKWTIQDVETFIAKVGFPKQAVAFREQEIDGKSLLLMKRSDVLTGLAIHLGPALKIYNHVQNLQRHFGTGAIQGCHIPKHCP